MNIGYLQIQVKLLPLFLTNQALNLHSLLYMVMDMYIKRMTK